MLPYKPDDECIYSETVGETNKLRDVYCPFCKYRTVTRKFGPKCNECRNSLITIVNNELVR